MDKNLYPNSKNELWRFADIKSFCENGVARFLKGENSLAKQDSILEGLGLDIASCTCVSLSAEGLTKGLGLDVSELAFEGELSSKLESLVVENAKMSLLKLNSSSPKLLISLDSSLSFSPALLEIEVEESATAQVFILQETTPKAFLDSLLNISLKKNSKLKITFINNTAEDSLLYSKASFSLGEYANLELFSMQKGVSPSRLELYFDMSEKYAHSEVQCFIKNDSPCLHNLNTYQMHKVGDTSSNLSLRNVLSGEAVATFAGFVKIDKDAQCVSAQQSCKTLLLDKSARINALPILEIEANDVECSHGCAVSMPDEEQIFYLKARGLSETQAKALIAEGFVNFDRALL